MCEVVTGYEMFLFREFVWRIVIPGYRCRGLESPQEASVKALPSVGSDPRAKRFVQLMKDHFPNFDQLMIRDVWNELATYALSEISLFINSNG